MLGKLTETVYFCKQEKKKTDSGAVSTLLLKEYKTSAAIKIKTERILIGARYSEVEVLEVVSRYIDEVMNDANNYFLLYNNNVYSILGKQITRNSSVSPRYMNLRCLYERRD